MTIEANKQPAIAKWSLTDIETIYENQGRAVYSATSEIYGQVILKINIHDNYLYQEYETLKEFQGNYSCKVYDYDEAEHMLLEERILPGTKLREEENIDRRLDGFVSVFKNIHNQTASEHETYVDWLTKVYDYLYNNNIDSSFTEKVRKALKIGQEMFEKYPERVLLHGDLHHDNILKDSDGYYKMIDPKGVIGPAIFDIPRFVMNELDTDLNKTGAEHIKKVIDKLAELLGYDVSDIRKLFYMEVILGNAWCLEDGEAIYECDINIATEVLEE